MKSALCHLFASKYPRQPKAGCHLLEVERWAGDRSRKSTCLRSFSDRNNYHAIIHWCAVFSFLYFCRLINEKPQDLKESASTGHKKKKKLKKKKEKKRSLVTALAWHICWGNVRVYSEDDSRITNKTWTIRLLSPYGLSLALACSGHVVHLKCVLKWVVTGWVYESGWITRTTKSIFPASGALFIDILSSCNFLE